ncbi:phosphoadenosine phosphosulfate reductase family protein [Mycobacterium xenopi 4042]|uniref:Phosphoadenosine phosphosulfate reductase family protein n=1 Tax=Mycobacterium xenopi 4042 TaxID=1299334 RepID=X8AR96_MYCXE|nr:phosphoadenosine phosphosulfate reductase family protein [Mycobacterium xenopi 4042]
MRMICDERFDNLDRGAAARAGGARRRRVGRRERHRVTAVDRRNLRRRQRPRGWATCNYVVASNMQDAVLVDLAAKVRPGVPVLFLDTGYHFVETIGTRDAIEAVYDVHVLNITPEHTVAEQDRLLGKNLFARDPNECCRLRKVARWPRRCAVTQRG